MAATVNINAGELIDPTWFYFRVTLIHERLDDAIEDEELIVRTVILNDIHRHFGLVRRVVDSFDSLVNVHRVILGIDYVLTVSERCEVSCNEDIKVVGQ